MFQLLYIIRSIEQRYTDCTDLTKNQIYLFEERTFLRFYLFNRVFVLHF